MSALTDGSRQVTLQGKTGRLIGLGVLCFLALLLLEFGTEAEDIGLLDFLADTAALALLVATSVIAAVAAIEVRELSAQPCSASLKAPRPRAPNGASAPSTSSTSTVMRSASSSTNGRRPRRSASRTADPSRPQPQGDREDPQHVRSDGAPADQSPYRKANLPNKRCIFSLFPGRRSLSSHRDRRLSPIAPVPVHGCLSFARAC